MQQWNKEHSQYSIEMTCLWQHQQKDVLILIGKKLKAPDFSLKYGLNSN